MRKCKTKGCFNNACTRQGLCVTCSPNQSRKEYAERPLPGDPNQMGIELECFATNEVHFKALTNVAEFACYDASLPTYGAELKVVDHENVIGRTAGRVAMAARDAGGMVDHRCGLHMHMDMRLVYRNVTDNSLSDLITWLTKAEPFFMSAVPRSRREGRYSTSLLHPNNGDTWVNFHAHHSWITWAAKHRTVELRIHPGTLNPHKIKAWTEVGKQLGGWIRNVLSGVQTSYPTFKTNPFTGLAKDYLDARIAGGGVLKTYDEVEA